VGDTVKLYENVVIGNFLCGLGVSVGNRLKSGYLPGAVSLLQQTPEDKALGDLLLAFPGTLRLIEFEAKGNRSKKELSKYKKLSIVLEGKQQEQEISRKVHWYVETAPSFLNGVETFFSLYIDAFTGKPHSKQPFVLESFIESIADDAIATKNQLRNQEEKDYLKLVRWCQGVGKTGVGALIVIVVAEGGMNFVALDDLMELNMSYSRWMDYQNNKELIREKTLSMEHQQKAHERGWSYGMQYERAYYRS